MSETLRSAAAPSAERCQSYLRLIVASGKRKVPHLRQLITAAAAASHPSLPPAPPPASPPSASAGQPQKRWLDSRETPILQPRQSRLHRWACTLRCTCRCVVLTRKIWNFILGIIHQLLFLNLT
ncbi:uncharacterized protein V6R79_016175 [Siganus canaliculatus]